MPVRSMTAFAHQRAELPWGTASWEIRSVNQRYLDLTFKLPELWRHLEPALRDSLRNTLARGKVEVTLRLQMQSQASESLKVNEVLTDQVIAAAIAIQAKLDSSAPIDPLRVLQWPGVVGDTQPDADEVQNDLHTLFAKALKELQSGREREGSELKAMIEQRLGQISEITKTLSGVMPQLVQAQRDKLSQRLEALQVQLNEERLEAEVAELRSKAEADASSTGRELAELKRDLAQAQSELAVSSQVVPESPMVKRRLARLEGSSPLVPGLPKILGLDFAVDGRGERGRRRPPSTVRLVDLHVIDGGIVRRRVAADHLGHTRVIQAHFNL